MLKYLWFSLSLLNTVFAQTTDKYSDEDRPYKFGFNIQGYQHRQEEKDERGLIKGEYGFITADGYYRVTVYATDENGDFKIISMKNYYVGFPPEDPTTAFPPASGSGRSPFSKPSSNNQPSTSGSPQENVQNKKAFNRPQGLAACSDCSIPTTTTRTNQIDNQVSGKELGGNGNFGKKPGEQFSQFQQESPRTGDQKSFRGQDPIIFPGKAFEKLSPQTSQFGSQAPKKTPGSSFQGRGRQNPQLSPENPKSKTQEISSGFQGSGPTNPGLLSRGINQPQLNKPGVFENPNFANERNDFAQNKGLNSSPRKPNIGEVRDGLPPGVTLKDIKDLLYTFNYTVGFHGHHEDGYRNGDKLGDYFFDGRDGVERKVEYLANEFGYQPNITLIDLPNNDVRIPKEESEKEYGLKGYEFKWFYRK